MKNIFIISALLWICLVLAGCGTDRDVGKNIYRGALVAKVKGFDPAHVSDLYSHICQKQVYESLYQYKYLARPYDVEPCLADSLPRISENGLRYSIGFKKGVYFSDDDCFPGGKGREALPRDFIYSLKRVCDSRTATTGWWLFEGRIKGLDEYRKMTAALSPDDTVDYFKSLEGLYVNDSGRIIIELKKPCPYFKYILTMAYTSVVPYEAVNYYKEEFLNNPVGTGPFILEEWWRGQKIFFRKNPSYSHGFYPSEGESEDREAGLLEDAGKAVPFLDGLELSVFRESQPMWLNFLKGNLDAAGIPKDNYNDVVTPGKSLRGKYAAKGITLRKGESLDLTYIIFNFNDPVLGSSPELRKAVSLAYDTEKMIDLFYNGRAIQAHSPIPPGIFGYEEDFRNPWQRHDIEAAGKMLEKAGYPGGEGLPEFEYLTSASTTARQMAEFFAAAMEEIGIKIKIIGLTFPEMITRFKENKFQIAGAAWGADYPDPENFLQLLYGPNASPGENSACYKNPEYDSLFRLISVVPDGPERLRSIKRMKEILITDCPWVFNTHRLSEALQYKWVKNSKPHAVSGGNYKYIRIDTLMRKKMLER